MTTTAATKPMSVLELIRDDGDVYGYYTKGHVPLDEFLEAVRKQWGDTDKPETVRHCWARLIPVTGKDYDQQFHDYDKPSRGAFAATFWESSQ